MQKAKTQQMINSISNPRQRLFMEFAFITQAIAARIDQCVTEFGLTAQQFNLLRILRGTHPRPQSMQEIKSKLVDRNSDATRLVARLVAKDWIQQKDSSLDKRKKEISISDQGLALLEQINQQYPNFPYSLIDFMSEEEVDVLIEKLTVVRETIQ